MKQDYKQKRIEEFRKLFLQGDYMGDGEEIEAFLLESMKEAERQTADNILSKLEKVEGVVFLKDCYAMTTEDFDKLTKEYDL